MHAFIRLQQRRVTLLEVEETLLNGAHEENKDIFIKKFNTWNYAISGSTLDGKILRVIVTFPSKEMLIVTVIDVANMKRKIK